MKDKLTLDKLHNFLHNEYKSPMNSEIKRKRYNGEIALLKDEDRTFLAKITTIDTDRDNEVIDPKGIDIESYMQNPVVLWDHQHSDAPIGKIVQIEKTSKEVFAKIKMASTQKAEEVWQLIKGGFIKACSIGFIATDHLERGTQKFIEKARELGADMERTVRIITECELIENSMVSLACNRAALITAISDKSISLSDEMIKTLNVPEKEVGDGDGIAVTNISTKKPIILKETEGVASESAIGEGVGAGGGGASSIVSIGGQRYRFSLVTDEVADVEEETRNEEETTKPAEDGTTDTEIRDDETTNNETVEGQEIPKEANEEVEVEVEDIEDIEDIEEVSVPSVPSVPKVPKVPNVWNVVRRGKRLVTNLDMKKMKKMEMGKIV